MSYFIKISVLLFAFVSFNCQSQEVLYRYNQLGYYPKSVKRALIVGTKASDFEIHSLEGETVFTGRLSESKYWDKSDEKIKVADFSQLTKPGKYSISIKNGGQSVFFDIKSNLYAHPFKAALKSYYFIRASQQLDEKYAGKWKRALGHPDTLCYFHPSTGQKETRNAAGGWYDAGDYNKYVVNAGVTVGTLLNFFEMYPAMVPDNFSNIPESKNSISDLLDEVKYELDWLLTMQAPDGASHMKLTSKNFTGFIMPQKDKTKRFVVGKATAPTLNMAAMMGQASRLFENVDKGFAQKCLLSAEKAWNWAQKNPNVIYKNPKDIVTGEYGDSIFVEEKWWAAAELYLATNKKEYLDYITSHKPYVAMEVGESWRKFLGNLGSFSILLSDSFDNSVLKEKIKLSLLVLADDLLKKQNQIPYRVAIDDFQWGSNSDVLNSAILFAYAYQLSKDRKYLDAIVETVDYIFGKNATAYSFMTGFGGKTPMFIHHRPSGADKVKEPISGFIVGGPNNNREDDIEKVNYGVAYPVKLPAKSYVDKEKSYASNETCINWNAPAVFVLGFLEANAKELE